MGGDLAVAVALIVIVIALLVAEGNGRIFRRGFFCDDESIRLPYIIDTVSTLALLSMSIGFPVVAVGGLCV